MCVNFRYDGMTAPSTFPLRLCRNERLIKETTTTSDVRTQKRWGDNRGDSVDIRVFIFLAEVLPTVASTLQLCLYLPPFH